MNEDDDILRASSPSPRSPVEETLANMSSRTIFDEPYDPSPYMPIDIDKARET